MRIQVHPKDHFYSVEIETEIRYYQPVILLSLDTLQKVLGAEDMAFVKWLYNFLWVSYKCKPFIDSIPVTPDRFIRAEYEATWLFDDMAELTDPVEREELLLGDLQGERSKELLAVLFNQFEVNELFKGVNSRSDGAVLAGVRALIECFDNNMCRRWLW